MSFDINKLRIGVIGLGYVGLPLAVEFGKQYPTVGFDIKAARIAELESGADSTLECSSEELAEAPHLSYASTDDAIADCNFYVVTVPTPIGDSNRTVADTAAKVRARRSAAFCRGRRRRLRVDGLPGRTEEFCVPILEDGSGLKMNEDFSSATARNASIRATKSIACRRSSK